jgi:hypothetical protein
MMKGKWMRLTNTLGMKKDTKRLGYAYVATGPILMDFIRATKMEMRWNLRKGGKAYTCVDAAEELYTKGR